MNLLVLRSEVHNFLGFAYRSDTDAEPWKARDYVVKGYAHYHASLTLNPENCGAPRSRQRLRSSLARCVAR